MHPLWACLHSSSWGAGASVSSWCDFILTARPTGRASTPFLIDGETESQSGFKFQITELRHPGRAGMRTPNPSPESRLYSPMSQTFTCIRIDAEGPFLGPVPSPPKPGSGQGRILRSHQVTPVTLKCVWGALPWGQAPALSPHSSLAWGVEPRRSDPGPRKAKNRSALHKSLPSCSERFKPAREEPKGPNLG